MEAEKKLIQITYEEYDRLLKIADDKIKPCEGINCVFQQIYNGKRFSISHAITGIAKLVTSPEIWVFIVYTYHIHPILFKDTTLPIYWIMYCVVGICFMFFKPLCNLISRGNLNIEARLEAKAGSTFNKELKL